MKYQITLMPSGQVLTADAGVTLLSALRQGHHPVDAPCGGQGKCQKCTVTIDGKEVLACRTIVDRDMTVLQPQAQTLRILTGAEEMPVTFDPVTPGYLLAFDIGTTTVAGYLLDKSTGRTLVTASAANPQAAFGGDVISRIQAALRGQMEELTERIRSCLQQLTIELCRNASITPEQIGVVSIVGNPAMQQLFMGILPDNLAAVPFSPVLTKAQIHPGHRYLPLWSEANVLIVPDIAGYVGADTVAGILACGMDTDEITTLLVDIGTNGEMVLGNQFRLVACSTAAGPALEGANIQFGMRAAPGAIDHVRVERGKFVCSVIGGGQARGICGSGLIDAVAAALELGLLNSRGKILHPEGRIPLADGIYLTQEDIRQLQLAKGAIAAGIQLLTQHLGLALEDIHRVCLAGAFGSYLDPASACRIGLLPPTLLPKITAMGNTAGSGARMLACSRQALERTQALTDSVEALELASAPTFSRCFAQNMRF